MRSSEQVKRWTSTLVAAAILTTYSLTASAQVRPVYDRGAAGLLQMLKRLNTSASVLMIGAHPDDEDTALLAYLARGENARTAYLSLTRGDGGQNIIGPELGESLGVIRTEELLQARRLDGAEQFFTRAYDYGFSKTLDEAKRKWDETTILCDAVKVIRHFRPIVVVSQFTGTSADGHGQHQFAGYISPLAVRAAGEANQCKDTGPVWTVKKLYVRHRGRQGEERLRINTGKYDPVLGRSYFEIAMEARSQHKSQEQGVLELRGDQFSSMNLQGSETRETSIFEGVDTTLSSVGGAELQMAVDASRRAFDPDSPSRMLSSLAKGYAIAARLSDSRTSDRNFFEYKEKQFLDAIELAGGIQIDALADSETVVNGGALFVGAKVFTPYKDLISVKDVSVISPPRWVVSKVEAPQTNTPAAVTREVALASAFFNISIPRDQQPTQPYWLSEPRDGDMFRWTTDTAEAHTLPVQPYYPRVSVKLTVDGTDVAIEKPVEFRFADDIRGEIRRNIDIVPAISVEMDRPLLIVARSDTPQTTRVVMTVTNYSRQPVSGVVTLNAGPASAWSYATSMRTVNLSRPGEKTAVTFDITIPAGTRPGTYPISGNVMIGEAQANLTMRTIAYPHIQTHRFYRRASIDAHVIDLKTANVKVGYIPGSGDRVPDAISQMGFGLEMITESELAGGNLSRFDTIVVGIRAYQVRADVVANNKRLLDFVRAGGTLIVQYQLPAYAQQNLTPFPATMGPRVTDENAPVKLLVPGHPLFNFPNKISEADFIGWVQERNLYNFSNLGPEYTGLLESHDAGEPENPGGLVIAKLGKGNYIYCSYSLFRQLPAGVSGSYRLLANLVSLPKAPAPK